MPRRSESFDLQCRHERPRAAATKTDGAPEWTALAKGLRTAFFRSSAVLMEHPAHRALSRVDVEKLRDELFSRGEWQAGAYTRTLLMQGDGYNVMLLSWAPGCASPVHAHSCAETCVKSNCFMLVLEGTLTETVYPEAAILADGESVDARFGVTRAREAGELAYINDGVGLHKVANVSGARAVSLHVYAPGWRRAPLYDEVVVMQEVFPEVDASGAEIDCAGWGDF